MACSIIRDTNNNIQRVLAPNGKDSILYKDINEVVPDKEDALQYWAEVYTPSFKEEFGDWEAGKLEYTDSNGEPLVENLSLPVSQKGVDAYGPDLTKKIQIFLEAVGVDVKRLDTIRDRNGEPLDVVAKADLLNRVIEVSEGREDASTLPEEAAHFFLELLPQDSALYKRMTDAIIHMQIYTDTVDEYKRFQEYKNSDGTLNYDKLKHEAITKAITTHILRRAQAEESDKNLSRWQKIWDDLLKFIHGIFSKAENNPFATAADLITDADISQLEINKELTGEFYQADESINKLLNDQIRIQLDNSIDKATGQKRHIYTVDGAPIKGSVTTVKVDAYYRKKFPNDTRSERQKQMDLLKAEQGDAIHLDIQNIFARYVDPKTGKLRDNPLAVGSIETTILVYQKMEQQMLELIDSYEDGTRFFNEMKIYDPEQKIAGSIDLVVVKPNGAADIYDWKSQEIFPGQTDIKQYKEPAYRIQLKEYRDILQKHYGFTQFDKVRAIPIATEFKTRHFMGDWKMDGLKDIDMELNPKLIPQDKEYLLPVVLMDEKTGDEKLDKLILKLRKYHEVVEGKKAIGREAKTKRYEELGRIRNAIRYIQTKEDVSKFLDLGAADMKRYMDAADAGELTKSDALHAYHIVTNIFLETSKLTQNYVKKLNEEFKTADDRRKQEIVNLKTRIGSVNSTASILEERMEDIFNDMGIQIAEKNGIENLLNAEKEIGSLAGWFNSLSTLPTKALNTFYKLLRRQNDLRDVNVNKMNEDMATIRKNLIEWGKRKGISQDKLFDGILEFNDKGEFQGKLLNKYQKEYYDKRIEAIKDEDTEWMIENTHFDDAAYKESAKKMAKVFSEIPYVEDEEENADRQAKAFANWKLLHEVVTPEGNINTKALFNRQNQFLRPKGRWETAKWKELYKKDASDKYVNDPLVKAYEYFQTLLRKSEELGILDEFNPGFIPSIHKDKIDRVVFGDNSFWSAVKPDGLLDKISSENDRYFPEIDPMNGQEVLKIPVYFKNDISKEREDGTKDYSTMSTDMFKVFSMWGTQMYTYEAMASIEDDVQVLTMVEQNKESLVTNKFGQVKVVDGKAETKDSNVRNAQMLEDFANYYLYNKAGKLAGTGSDKKIKVFGKEVSAMKSFRFAVQWFSFKTLALNPFSGTAQFVGGTGNAFFAAMKKTQFNRRNWSQGMYQLTKRDPKALALLDYMDVFLEDHKRRDSNNLTVSGVVKHMSFDSMMDKGFVIQRTSDKLVQYPVALAMMNNHMLDADGNIISIDKYVKDKHNYNTTFYNLPAAEQAEVRKQMDKEILELEKTKSIYAIAKIEDDKLVIPGLNRTDETVSAFRGKIRKVNKTIIGNSTHEDVNLIRTTTLGMALMQFRSWIPQMAKERFGSLQKDADLETYSLGKTSLFFSELFKRPMSVAQSLITGFGASGIEAAKARYQEEKIKAAEEGRDFDMSEGEFIDLYIGSLRSQLRELIVLLGFFTMLMMLKNMGDDDDDEELKGLRKYAARGFAKYYNEFSFYYNPLEFTKLLGKSLPVVGLAEDFQQFGTHLATQGYGFFTGDEDIMSESHPMKYFGRIFPVAKEAITLTAAMDDDFRKENAIRIE